MTKVQMAPGIPNEKSRTVRPVHGPATIHLSLQGYALSLRDASVLSLRDTTDFQHVSRTSLAWDAPGWLALDVGIALTTVQARGPEGETQYAATEEACQPHTSASTSQITEFGAQWVGSLKGIFPCHGEGGVS